MKSAIRSEMVKKREAMIKGEAEEKSAKIAERLSSMAEYKNSKAVMFYSAKGREVGTARLIKSALENGKKVMLPVTNISKGEIEIGMIESYPEGMKKGPFGIMEPEKGGIGDDELETVIVPGVAFDSRGHRLGYGKGFYDQLLGRLAAKGIKVRNIGLAYDFQVVEKLPAEAHDHRMNFIVTDKKTIRCRE